MTQALIGKKAPQFSTKAVVNGEIVEGFSLADFEGKYVVFFFYPLDFTFVCPTELHAFQNALSLFQKKGAEVIGCSVDSPFAHLAWLNMPKSKGGIEGVSYPLVADVTKEIAKAFQVLKEEEGVAYRGLFLIDTQGIVRHLLINDLPLGRSVDEALRMLDALQSFEEHGEVCPANWSLGQQTMQPTAEGVESYFTSRA